MFSPSIFQMLFSIKRQPNFLFDVGTFIKLINCNNNFNLNIKDFRCVLVPL